MKRFHSSLCLLALTYVFASCGTKEIAASVDKTLSAEHVAALRGASAATISPDGKNIAYTLSVPQRPFADENGSAHRELHLVAADGSLRPFITGKVSIGGVQWTPDSTGISFLAKRNGDSHRSLYVLPVHGGEARRVVVHESGSISEYAWSPDGKRIVYLAMEAKSKESKELAKQGFNQEVVEEQLRINKAYLTAPDPYQRNVFADEDTKAPTKDSSDAKEIDFGGSVTGIQWSPDGNNLFAFVAPSSLIDDHYMKRKPTVVAIDENGKTKVIATFQTPGKVGQAVWSPDGSRIALIASGDLHDPSAGRIAILTVSTQKLVFHLMDYKGQVESIQWAKDGAIYYTCSEGAESLVKKIKADGSGNETVIPAGQFIFRGLTIDKSGTKAALIGHTPKHPSEVVSIDLALNTAKRITDSNPWLDGYPQAKQETVTWKARDGLEIQGVLIHPLKRKEGELVPLIVVVHGGPESHISNGWVTYYSRPGQVAAAQGYAVLHPNYRGSTGRGVKFSKLDQGDYAGPEFDDLVDGAKHLANIGLVDIKRVGVTGGSYGGFASAWCATALSEHFAASVMFVGISDQISKFGTTDIPKEMKEVHALKWPWEDWKFFRERSPIMYIEKARTPILIMHGKEDTRVHPTQSMELFRYLKNYGKTPVRLVLYPGEGHGNRKAAARFDYSLRLMRWMNHYLKGPGGEPPDEAIDYSPYKPRVSTKK